MTEINPDDLDREALTDEERTTDDDLAVIETALAKQEDDPGAVFEPPVLAAMGQLRQQDIAQWQRIRARIKKAKVSIRDLDTAIPGQAGGEGDAEGGNSQAGLVVTMVNSMGVKLFHDTSDAAFAEITTGAGSDVHAEIWPIESQQFRKWLSRAFWAECAKTLREQSSRDALSTLCGIAEHEGEEHPVHLRIASDGSSYFLDLCNEGWQVLQITPGAGWRVLDSSPLKFRRTGNMEPLPIPERNGSFAQFWKHLNLCASDRDFVVAYLIEALRPDTPFVVMEINGGQGSAKSTLQRAIRRLIDPNKVDLRGAPKSTEDIWSACVGNHVLSYENLSLLYRPMQDAFCTIATAKSRFFLRFSMWCLPQLPHITGVS